MIPKEISAERMEKCNKCNDRKYFAKEFDIHFDWIDCIFDCENDLEHWKKECEVDNDLH